MRIISPLLLAIAIGLCSCAAQTLAQPGHGPVYARQRAALRSYGGWQGANHFARFGTNNRYGVPYRGFYPYRQPVIVGNWYARPYPSHFDYYRQRWSAPQPVVEERGVDFPVEQ